MASPPPPPPASPPVPWYKDEKVLGVLLAVGAVAAVVGVLVTSLGVARDTVDYKIGDDPGTASASPTSVGRPDGDPRNYAEPSYTGGWGPDRKTYTIKSPSPTASINSIVDNPAYGDERNFVQCRQVFPGDGHGVWGDSITLDKPGQVEVYAILDNAVTPSYPDQNVINTTMVARLPDGPADDPGVGVKFKGTNQVSGSEVWAEDGCRLYTSSRVALSVLPGSGRVYSFGFPEEGMPISDGVLAGRELLPAVGTSAPGTVPALGVSGTGNSYGYFKFIVLAVPI
ncbi:hypothetical protein [Nocardia farcinica]|uniref:hypothetical protein n=1 Tax=Nocardia farcinica TaxID=37329 RepID=UPI0024567DD3|nr:hypothetical protein [Nocardia farcinica]